MPTTPVAALTTVFTPPVGCPIFDPTSIYLLGRTESSASSSLVQSLSSCFPQGYTITELYGYFSPGICPVSYTPACSAFRAEHTASVKAGESAIICCSRCALLPTGAWKRSGVSHPNSVHPAPLSAVRQCHTDVYPPAEG